MLLRGRNVRVRGQWWHYQFEVAGKTYSGSTGLGGVFSNKSAAEAVAERERQAVAHPAGSEERGPKAFCDAAGDFCAWARNVEYRGKPNTALRLKGSMSSCVEYFGERPVDEIAPADLEAYKQFRIEQHGVRDITLRHDLHALSVFFQYARKMGWAGANPVKEVKIPSDRDAIREHVVSAEEEGAYLRTALRLFTEWARGRTGAQPSLHDLAVLMLETGARPEELLAARKDAFDGAALKITGGKTRAARRTLPLTGRAAAVCERRLATAGPWLFPSSRRPGQHATQMGSTHDRICIEAGLTFVIYDFRHTWATRMIQAGADVPTVAALMGHSGLRTIFRYVHPTEEHRKATMERFEAAGKRKGLKVVNE